MDDDEKIQNLYNQIKENDGGLWIPFKDNNFKIYNINTTEILGLIIRGYTNLKQVKGANDIELQSIKSITSGGGRRRKQVKIKKAKYKSKKRKIAKSKKY